MAKRMTVFTLRMVDVVMGRFCLVSFTQTRLTNDRIWSEWLNSNRSITEYRNQLSGA